jgi:tagatose 1,6-diphosphate aldolase GatY/KbaY
MSFGGTALIAACRDLAARSTIPIAIQLDHASDESAIVAALNAGVDAVMADGSHLPLQENTLWTAKIAKLAHECGATVEADLDKLAGEEDGLAVPEREAKMTDPDIVAAFLQATQVDALAVTIGNVHGKYATSNPELDFSRLDRIRTAAGGPDGIPLVLHGASGLPESTIHEAISRGVCKFNVNTEVRAAAKEAVKDGCAKNLDVLDLMKASAAAMTPVIASKIDLFKTSSNRQP